jgi:hypothetical protein
MALNNLTTLTTTATTNSFALIVNVADRLGLGFAAQAYPTDDLSPVPASPAEARSRQEQSEAQMRKQMPPEGSKPVPAAPGGTVGRLTPGSHAVAWRNRVTVSARRTPDSRDCHSPARNCDTRGLLRHAVCATTAAK